MQVSPSDKSGGSLSRPIFYNDQWTTIYTGEAGIHCIFLFSIRTACL